MKVQKLKKNEIIKNITKAELLNSCIHKTKNQIKHYKIGSFYKGIFGEWIPIDICHKKEKLLEKDVKKINSFLQLELNHAALLEPNHGSRFVSYFGKNKAKVRSGSFTTPPIGLGMPGKSFNKSQFYEAELIWLEGNFKVPFFNEKTELCMTVDSKKFLELFLEDKKTLLDKQVLKDVFTKIYPRWLTEAELCHKFQEGLKSNLDDIKQDKEAYENLYEDTLQFCEIHPSFYRRWEIKKIFN
jgi:hypothetical protein